MDFRTTNDYCDSECTGLRGYVNATYDELVAVFGPHETGDGYKTDCEWIIKFLTEVAPTVATIYNYKTAPCYAGAAGTPKEQETYWHIGGGKGPACPVALVKAALEKHRGA